MRWVSPSSKQKFWIKAQKQARWHRWFAWYPVRIYDPEIKFFKKCWLENVGRRKTVYHRYGEYSLNTNRQYLGHVEYCFEEDVVVRALREPEINDARKAQIKGEWERPNDTKGDPEIAEAEGIYEPPQ
jgi:hypothetical protein